MWTLAVLCALAQDPLQDPAAGWKDFGTGSWIRLKGTTKFMTQGKVQTVDTETKYVLVEKGEDKLTLEVYSTAMGQTDKQIQELKLKPEPGKLRVRELSKGEEDVEVAGKKLRCAWTEYLVETDESKAVTRLWISRDVPGQTVKMKIKLSKPSEMEVDMTAVEFLKK